MDKSRTQLLQYCYDDIVHVQRLLRVRQQKGLADVLNETKRLLRVLMEEQHQLDKD